MSFSQRQFHGNPCFPAWPSWSLFWDQSPRQHQAKCPCSRKGVRFSCRPGSGGAVGEDCLAYSQPLPGGRGWGVDSAWGGARQGQAESQAGPRALRLRDSRMLSSLGVFKPLLATPGSCRGGYRGARGSFECSHQLSKVGFHTHSI